MALTDSERKAKVLGRRGLQAKVARTLNVHPTLIGQVVAGRKRSKRVERAIAKSLRMAQKDVFPPRLASNGASPAA